MYSINDELIIPLTITIYKKQQQFFETFQIKLINSIPRFTIKL